MSFIGLFVVPEFFDRGTGGLSVDTCPYVINKHSDAWWVSIVIVGLIWWSGVGVLKAAGVSFRRRERRVVGVVSASLVAIALALLADFVLAFSNVCPF